jgi:hypothetical protein
MRAIAFGVMNPKDPKNKEYIEERGELTCQRLAIALSLKSQYGDRVSSIL